MEEVAFGRGLVGQEGVVLEQGIQSLMTSPDCDTASLLSSLVRGTPHTASRCDPGLTLETSHVDREKA